MLWGNVSRDSPSALTAGGKVAVLDVLGTFKEEEFGAENTFF